MQNCRKPFYTQIKIKIYHLKSRRITWQTWVMCNSCFFEFLYLGGKGYFCEYKNGKRSPVIGFRLEMLSYPYEFDQEFVPLELQRFD